MPYNNTEKTPNDQTPHDQAVGGSGNTKLLFNRKKCPAHQAWGGTAICRNGSVLNRTENVSIESVSLFWNGMRSKSGAMMTRTDVLGVIVLSSDLQSHHPSCSCLYLLFTSLVTPTHLTNLCVFTFFLFLDVFKNHADVCSDNGKKCWNVLIAYHFLHNRNWCK